MNNFISRADFEYNLAAVQERIRNACKASGRDPASVTLLPVTKTHPVEAAAMAYEQGLYRVGENRVQEAGEKIPLAPDSLRWELIGHLQSNKARQAAELFARIQSVDSIKLLKRLNKASQELDKSLSVLLQFNTGRDPGKFGVLPEDAEVFAEAALACDQLKLEGLMTIAPLEGGRDAARRAFAGLRELRDRLESSTGQGLPELSMGMSGDLELAIAEGSTEIRLGSALFGTRQKKST